MIEIRTRLIPVRVELECPACGEGGMLSTGQCLTSMPPQYSHVCDKCGYSEVYRGKSYPYIEYENDSK